MCSQRGLPVPLCSPTAPRHPGCSRALPNLEALAGCHCLLPRVNRRAMRHRAWGEVGLLACEICVVDR